ncbi:NUDIX domain-containing protein [Parasphingopyxis algicola]|uniref:NUDIX hydrolase n=1 Tax=Parasphingopyxis algicola TaxID=2026624 RepID=UPI0015A3863C|nr:NUDIX domain-containing protein [Parasphingopyxis algicola]QLC25898.1 NUDIX domain-containing protein [Parasphingopyxis algicola]
MTFETETKPGIPAATLVLVRDRPQRRPELLMVERAAKMRFAGGAMVFPGGRIDPGDHALAENDSVVRGAPGDPLQTAARIAAIRETLEETGVAVAFDPLPDHGATVQLREALHEEADFGAMLASGGWQLDLRLLTPWARWKPNFKQERSFDTWFFVAKAPDLARDEADGGESVSSRWASARRVIDEAEAGKCSIIFPTHRNLERLAIFESYEETRIHAEAHEVKLITPWVEERNGEKYLRIPDDAGYPVTAQRLTEMVRG